MSRVRALVEELDCLQVEVLLLLLGGEQALVGPLPEDRLHLLRGHTFLQVRPPGEHLLLPRRDRDVGEMGAFRDDEDVGLLRAVVVPDVFGEAALEHFGEIVRGLVQAGPVVVVACVLLRLAHHLCAPRLQVLDLERTGGREGDWNWIFLVCLRE